MKNLIELEGNKVVTNPLSPKAVVVVVLKPIFHSKFEMRKVIINLNGIDKHFTMIPV